MCLRIDSRLTGQCLWSYNVFFCGFPQGKVQACGQVLHRLFALIGYDLTVRDAEIKRYTVEIRPIKLGQQSEG
jgi:hypothetical protein